MQTQALTIAHITSENTLCEFPLVIATVAKVPRKRGLWLAVHVFLLSFLIINFLQIFNRKNRIHRMKHHVISFHNFDRRLFIYLSTVLTAVIMPITVNITDPIQNIF